MKKTIKNYALMTIGAFIAAVAIDAFLVPNKLAAGGISGLATIIHYMFKFPVGTVTLVFNIPIFIAGVITEGKNFGIKSIITTILFSLFLNFFSFLKPITNDVFLSSLFGGIIMGAGLALVFIAGSTTGGTDIIAKVLQRFFRHMPIGRLIFLSDFTIILFGTIVFRNVEIGLYSVITLIVSTFVIDKVIDGGKSGKMVFIISNNSIEISQKIISELKRGVTGIMGIGMYSNEEKTIIMCTLRGRQIPTLKDIVYKCDKRAFITLTDVREVVGEGFEEY